MPLRVATVEGGAYSRMEGLGKRGASGVEDNRLGVVMPRGV